VAVGVLVATGVAQEDPAPPRAEREEAAARQEKPRADEPATVDVEESRDDATTPAPKVEPAGSFAAAIVAAGGRVAFASADEHVLGAVRWYGKEDALPQGPITGVQLPSGDASAFLDGLAASRSLCVLGAYGVRFDDAALARLAHLPLLDLQLGRTGISGAALETIGRMTTLRSLMLHNTSIDDGSLGALRALSRLTMLDVHDTQITDAWLEHIGALTGLESLRLGQTRVTDAGVEHLANLRALRKLDHANARVTGAGVKHIPLAHLEEIPAEEAGAIDDSLLEALRGAPALKRLNLEETAVTDKGLAHLAQLPALDWLKVDHTAVTDAGIAHLAGLTTLRNLSIADTAVGDGAVPDLARRRGLRSLRCDKTRLTASGLAKLREALPDCRVR
jgi:hypothetical protein